MIDIKDVYLNMPIKRFEYMKLKMMIIPEEIKTEYKLHEITSLEGYIYCEIQKGMHVLPQAGIMIAEELLAQ